MEPRHFVHIAVGGTGDRADGRQGVGVVALANDGTLWTLGVLGGRMEWLPLPECPQPPPPPERD